MYLNRHTGEAHDRGFDRLMTGLVLLLILAVSALLAAAGETEATDGFVDFVLRLH